MVPGLGLRTPDVLAQEHRFVPLVDRGVEFGVNDRGIATIAEFGMVTLTAKGAIDSNHCSAP
jgi:hypothetical protein